MAFALFQADQFQGAPQGGVPSYDQPTVFPEDELSLPWGVDPEVSWLDYQCWVEIMLDAGMALHKPLPQKNPTVDSLASVFIDGADLATSTDGVNLASSSDATDIIQRMATSTYRFILRGYGYRVGYQIPIPGIKAIVTSKGKRAAVPEGTQRATNLIVGNLAGIPLWFGFWEIPYIVAEALTKGTAPVPANPALHIGPKAKLPAAILLPRTVPDQRAVQIVPQKNPAQVVPQKPL